MKLLREEKVYQKNDERILGDGDFVGHVPAFAKETMEKRYALRSAGLDLEGVASRVSEYWALSPRRYRQQGSIDGLWRGVKGEKFFAPTGR